MLRRKRPPTASSVCQRANHEADGNKYLLRPGPCNLPAREVMDIAGSKVGPAHFTTGCRLLSSRMCDGCCRRRLWPGHSIVALLSLSASPSASLEFGLELYM